MFLRNVYVIRNMRNIFQYIKFNSKNIIINKMYAKKKNPKIIFLYNISWYKSKLLFCIKYTMYTMSIKYIMYMQYNYIDLYNYIIEINKL